MGTKRVIVVGGGAAGFFAAIACAEAGTGAEVVLLEKGPEFLTKVRISGGGRCNVTHACFDAREFTTWYPRGQRELIGPFHRFQASDTVAWFESRGVKLKREDDGRMFPQSDSSETVINCLLHSARAAGVKLLLNSGVERVARVKGGFEVELERRSPTRHEMHNSSQRAGSETGAPFDAGGKSSGEKLFCRRLLLATGGCRTPALGQIAVALGHTLESPVPSLFTFQVETPWLRTLAGVTVEAVEASVPGTKLRERGPVLVTHRGLSGPVILRLSAWGARVLHGMNYRFPLRINWLPHLSAAALEAAFQSRRRSQAARFVVNSPIAPLPARLWEQLILAAGVGREVRWSAMSRGAQRSLVRQLTRTELPVSGKSLNKEEFVTCGGIRLSEVNFKTMESRICPGLHFAGELLDIDGITGGFNFQAAWSTGWIAGRAMAGAA